MGGLTWQGTVRHTEQCQNGSLVVLHDPAGALALAMFWNVERSWMGYLAPQIYTEQDDGHLVMDLGTGWIIEPIAEGMRTLPRRPGTLIVGTDGKLGIVFPAIYEGREPVIRSLADGGTVSWSGVLAFPSWRLWATAEDRDRERPPLLTMKAGAN